MNRFQKTKQCGKILILAGLSVVSLAASAAEPESKANTLASSSFSIAPSLGYTYFNISGSDANYSSKAGNSAGVLVQTTVMDNQVELETGLEYLETGAKQTYDFGIFSIDLASLTIKQLAVPLRAKYFFNPTSEGTRWFGKAGITPTFLMSANADVYGGQSTDVKSDMNSIGALAQMGVGADWSPEAIKGRISLDLTYNYGLTKVFKDTNGRATGYHLQAGYIISL